MSNIVEVKDLIKKYGPLVAVDGISFSVEEGEILGVLGPNGAGKTTTVEMIEGLRKPDSGYITLFGMDAAREGRAIKERIGIQLQATSLYDRVRVKEILELFAGYFSKSLPSAQLLNEVSLQDKQNSFVDKLSGGQKQRLALALALVNDPDVLFLDEPTTGLDPQARRNVWSIISRLRDRGKTILLTTHYMEEAEELCQRVAIMDHGKIIALDTPEALVRQADLDTSIEIDSTQKDLQALVRRMELPAKITGTNGKMLIQTRQASTVMKEITLKAVEADIDLGNIVIRKATLEDVFLALTGRQLRE